MTCYADTSFVFSLYGSDGNSPAAVTEMESVTTCMLSELTLFEFENALATYRFRKDISLEDMDRCLKAFHEDVASGLLRVHPFPHEIFAQATALSREHTPRIGNRALDVLHVAIPLRKIDAAITRSEFAVHSNTSAVASSSTASSTVCAWRSAASRKAVIASLLTLRGMPFVA